MDNAHDARTLNLASHRAPESVWERRGWDGTPERLAISRVLVGVGGSLMLLQGVRQRSTLTGKLLAGIGGSVAWWALSGEGDLSAATRWCRQAMDQLPWSHDDSVQQASNESFPASDAPSWTPTVGTGLRRNAGRR